MRLIDFPPVWLLAFLAAAWLQAQYAPTPFPQPLGHDIGAFAILCGIVLTASAMRQFQRHKTTIHPHRDAAQLITSGIFSKSRNPIYLADVLFLAGFALWWGSVLGLLLVPVLVTILTRRFIHVEEARLRLAFGESYENYAQQTRRWL